MYLYICMPPNYIYSYINTYKMYTIHIFGRILFEEIPNKLDQSFQLRTRSHVFVDIQIEQLIQNLC